MCMGGGGKENPCMVRREGSPSEQVLTAPGSGNMTAR